MEDKAAPSVGKVSWHMKGAQIYVTGVVCNTNVTFLVGVPARDLATDQLPVLQWLLSCCQKTSLG